MSANASSSRAQKRTRGHDMLITILGWITGLLPAITHALDNLSNLEIAKTQAKSATEIAEIDAKIAAGHDRVMVLQAEAWSRLNMIMRFLLAFGPMVYLNKLFVFDKVIGSFLGHSKAGDMFSTDSLDSNLWMVVTVVLSFYFVNDMVDAWRKMRAGQ